MHRANSARTMCVIYMGTKCSQRCGKLLQCNALSLIRLPNFRLVSEQARFSAVFLPVGLLKKTPMEPTPDSSSDAESVTTVVSWAEVTFTVSGAKENAVR